MMSKTFKSSRLYRAAQIRAEDVNEDDRIVVLSFSSTAPVDRMFGVEILEHGADNVDLSRLNDGGPLLSDHDTSRQIGVIERAWLTDGKGHAEIRFSRSDRAQIEFQDVVDGIRRNVSVGYRIEEIREKPKTNEVRVTRWTPLEISLVSVAADPTVGVGREADEENDITVITEVETMEDNTEQTQETRSESASGNQAQQQPPVTETAAPQISMDDVLRQERARCNEIRALAQHFDQVDAGNRAEQAGVSVADFRQQLLDIIRKRSEGQAFIGMTPKETQRYSFLKAIRAQLFPNDRRYQEAAAFEREVSDAAAKIHQGDVRGILVAYDVLRANRQTIAIAQRAPLTTIAAGAAAELVGTDHLGSNFIDILRNATRVIQLGATELNGLQGDVAIPKQTASTNSGWVDPEGSDGPEVPLGTGQIVMAPKQLSGWQEYSRKLLLQSDPSVEGLVERDLAAGQGLALDLAALYGTGASGQPSGITVLVSQMAVNFAAATPTWGEIVDMESAVAVANGDVGSQAYLMGSAMRGALKQTTKDAGSGQFIWADGSNTVNGYTGGVSNQVTAGDVFFAVWSQLLVGQWGALDIMVNPYSNDKSGTIRVTAHSFYDINIRHAESFAWNNDGI